MPAPRPHRPPRPPLRSPSPSASSAAAHQVVDEQQHPFLPPPDPGGAAIPTGRPRPRRPLLALLLLAILSASALSALLLLGLSSSSGSSSTAPPPLPQHQADGENASAGTPPPPPAPSTPGPVPGPDHPGAGTTVRYADPIPPEPRLRDPSAYLLSPAWDRRAPPTTRVHDWTVLDGQLNPDGIFRPMLLVNNQFPGPLVEGNDGDEFVVRLRNRAANATALHFHGLFQNGSNAMDGAVGVTQCPVAPGTDFTYRFRVRGQAGTYWYHAHFGAQTSDGLLGPIVIHHRLPPGPSLPPPFRPSGPGYASDRVIMLQDHYHNTSAQLLVDYLQPGRENDEPVPDSALLNGRGPRRRCADFPGWPCRDRDPPPPPPIDLAAPARHRLRFINVGAFAQFQVELDEHPFHVTEVDGTDVHHPEPFHRLNILPAQRYSIVVDTGITTTTTTNTNTNTTTRGAFWLRARMVAHCFTTENPHLEPEVRAIVRHVPPGAAGAAPPPPLDLPAPEPTSVGWGEAIEVLCRDLNTTALRPVHPVTPPPADHFVALRANFMIGAWRLSRGFFNDSTWHANATYPSLHRFLDAAAAAADGTILPDAVAVNDRLFPRSTALTLQTRGVRTVDISLNNFDDGAHPFHLHGHKFFVLAQGRDGYPPNADSFPAYLDAHGGLPPNPLRRDTVTVESYAWVIIRVVLDNPGFWMFHCHNTWHSEAGMLMQLLVRADLVQHWEVDQEMRSMCGREGVTLGARPEDSVWFGSS